MKIRSNLHRLSLLNQWRKDPVRFLIFLIILLVAASIIFWVLPVFFKGNVHGGIVGIICGLSVNFWLTCISTLTLDTVVCRPDVIKILEKFRYRITEAGYYDLPVHRLKKFSSQRVYIEVTAGGMVITGPHNILKKVVNHLNTVS